MSVPAIKGFVAEPKMTPNGRNYRGRLTLPGVQWTGTGADAFATATVTVEQIADAAEGRMLWTDQSVQRGIKPGAPATTPRELDLSAGYPDDRLYVFDSRNADEMTQKLLGGERLFLDSLVWNLRPKTFSAFWSREEDEISIYDGKIYLPDSHHRHQAIVKAARAYRDEPRAYPHFTLERQFKVELYFLSRTDEGNYFFDKNQRPTPVALSKAYDLTTQDDLSVLAKLVLEKAPSWSAGVNRVTDRLGRRAPHFVTLSTLRELLKNFSGQDEFDETELQGLAATAADFLELLSATRAELRPETTQVERDGSLASAATIIIGYAALMRQYNADVGKLGPQAARQAWLEKLTVLSDKPQFTFGEWKGDFFSTLNPYWVELGITKLNGASDRPTVLNTGGARAAAGRALTARIDGKILIGR